MSEKQLVQLTDLGFETEEVVIRPAKNNAPAQVLAVRGIAFTDIMKLFRVHGPDMIRLYTALTVEDGEEADIGPLFVQAIQQAPELVADLIVLAADQTDTVGAHRVAMRLPLPVQLDALEKITRLTLEDHGGLGELLQTVVRMFGGLNNMLQSLSASKTGSDQSGES